MTQPVDMTSGPPETILAPEPDEAVDALRNAGNDRDEVSRIVGRFPRFLDGWATLGDLARDNVEAYACYRVGYHRGLDRLRQSGWRGNGYVRWRHESNRGFLKALDGLRRAAHAIGERDEEERCAQFLVQLDPDFSAS